MTRGQVLRLIWIDAFIEQGSLLLNREHIKLALDISIPQASLDLQIFQQIFPGRIRYDKSLKGYCRGQAPQPFTDHEHKAALLAGAAAAEALNRIMPLLATPAAQP